MTAPADAGEGPDGEAAPSGGALPPDFDVDLYLSHPANRDLKGFAAVQARHHYERHGEHEGRPASAVTDRESFKAFAGRRSPILEIGPFCIPAFVRPASDVRYLDALSTRELRARARGLDWADPDKVPPIDFVWRGEPYLKLTGRRFASVFSSHAVEHQPCLVSHLRDVSSVLEPGGRFFVVLPDKRYCFDHFAPETTLADVLDAFCAGRRRHTARSILVDRLLHTHNDPQRHWRGDHGADPYRFGVDELRASMIRDALSDIGRAAASPSAAYVDAHAWHLTPRGFRYIADSLCATGLTDLRAERVYPTAAGSMEFFAILGRGGPAAR